MRSTDNILPTTMVLKQIALPLLLMLLMLLLSGTEAVIHILPSPDNSPDSAFYELALWFSDSGHFPNVALVGLVCLFILVSGKNFSRRTRWYIVIYAVLISVAFAGGGAWVNENIIKEKLKHPRPNIEYLAGETGNGPLAMTAYEFYQGSTLEGRTKSQRSDILQQVLNRQPAADNLSAGVREHWIKETGYSFPSGHSFAALFFASFFLALGLSYVTDWRKYIFYFLIPWAVAVCYSRLVLRVHTPLDIIIGGLEGLFLGITGFLLFRFIMKNYHLQG